LGAWETRPLETGSHTLNVHHRPGLKLGQPGPGNTGEHTAHPPHNFKPVPRPTNPPPRHLNPGADKATPPPQNLNEALKGETPPPKFQRKGATLKIHTKATPRNLNGGNPWENPPRGRSPPNP